MTSLWNCCARASCSRSTLLFVAASFVCAAAPQASRTAAAEPGENAEVVPLPDDEATEPKTPPVPKPPPDPVKAEPKKDSVKKPPGEPPKEAAKEPAKEPSKEAAKEPTKEPPKEPAKAPPKELAKQPPKEPPKEPAKAEPAAPPADTAENVTEPPGETVPLPADKPATPGDGTAAKGTATQNPDDWEAPMLTTETPTVLPGQTAVFSLYGPETALRRATARYVVRDEFGRHLSQGTVRVADLPFSEGKPRQIKVEVKNPLAQWHVFELLLEGADGKQTQVRSGFVVPTASRWESWIALIATPPQAFPVDPALPRGETAGWVLLRTLGIRGGLQYRLHPARREALRKGNAPFFVENIARQLLSRYHTERGLWEKTIAAMAGNRADRTPLMRDPSLCSQAFAEAFAKELKRHAEHYAKDPPLFYSLASEPSVTRLAAAADFDFSPAALEEFQRWLERDVYGTLKALNASWDTQFAAWTDVVPMTTDEARLRLRDGVLNVGPWVDFRDFQDYCFSKVLRDGAEYIRKYDSNAKVGITGALGPSAFGGWDWARLARALDVVECYDIGCARALWRDLAPGKPALAAIPLAGEPGNAASAEACRTIWSLALDGGPRGVLLWDDLAPESASGGAEGPGSTKRALLDAEGKPTPLAQTLATPLRTLDGETGALLAQSAAGTTAWQCCIRRPACGCTGCSSRNACTAASGWKPGARTRERNGGSRGSSACAKAGASSWTTWA
ncbi:MAG: beta-galactosidase [Planctomycetota bacterium]|nr:beta-galactosidase [Planctomycetota bacterium]